MKILLLSAVALGTLGLASGAQAAKMHVRVNPYYGLTAEEYRDYQMEQMERRQEMERERLEARQLAERRRLDPDED